jgi:RNA polymerase sigma-70 factor, ECF subfamily
MSKDVSEKASLELAFLAALDSIHADVDTSEIGEIQDWSRAVRGKFHGASVREKLLPPEAMDIMRRWHATNMPDSSAVNVSGAIPMASANTATHLTQYPQMAIPQLIAVGIAESSEEAWSEFVRRSQSLIIAVITKAIRRFGNVSNQLVDDLTQNVYLKLCADNFRVLRNVEILQENTFWGFLRVVAKHTVEDYFRNACASKGGTAYELEAPIEAPSASPTLEREILLQEIDLVLKTLSHGRPNFARDRAIFWLYYHQGLSAKEISTLPDIKLNAKGVESTLLRLTRQIRSALTQRAKKPK